MSSPTNRPKVPSPPRPPLSFKALGLTLLILAVVLTPIFLIVNSQATSWINGDRFQIMLDGETSKGLKLVAHYTGLSRVGLLGIHADSFHGTDGLKTIVSLDANDISGSFNPLGVVLRRWQVDNIHIKSGTVMLQKTDFTPVPGQKAPGMPWWGIFWPYRVHLEDVKVDEANVLFNLKDKEAGIYKTFLEITPHGHDFEYDGKGGQFKTPMTPPLEVKHIHLLILRPRLYCPEFILADGPSNPDGQIHIEGDAGLQEDRSIKLSATIHSLSVSPWLPEKMREHVLGFANGQLSYTSSDTGIENASGGGSITVEGGVLHELPQIVDYLKVTESPDPGDILLKKCQVDVHWAFGVIKLENINIESPGIFRLQGHVTIEADKTLDGELELGLTNPYLKWLPTARQNIFTIDDGNYHNATIKVSGTLQKPQQDLTERITQEIESSPTVALKLFFNQAAEWFNFD